MHVYMTTQRDLTNQNLWTQGISRILSILYKCLFLHYLDQVFFYPLTLWKLLLALQTSQQMQHPSQTNKNRQTKGIKGFFFAHVFQVFFCPSTLKIKASISNATQIYIYISSRVLNIFNTHGGAPPTLRRGKIMVQQCEGSKILRLCAFNA